MAGIAAVWAGGAIPMGVLGWVVAPAVADHLSGPAPLFRALLGLLTIGLIWQFVLVAILVRHELRRDGGQVTWPRIKDALWLHRPTDPRTGRFRARLWWWLVPFTLIFAAEQFLPSPPVVASHDFGSFLDSTAGQDFFAGNWAWFAVAVVLLVFNTVLGEELLFRGWLLPRMNAACGRWDWVVNGALFALYHLHTPWAMATAWVDMFALAYPTKRFRSAWFGIIIHSVQSLVLLVALLALVLG